ncbi:MAG: ComF family protein [Planctomycetales bacterium]
MGHAAALRFKRTLAHRAQALPPSRSDPARGPTTQFAADRSIRRGTIPTRSPSDRVDAPGQRVNCGWLPGGIASRGCSGYSPGVMLSLLSPRLAASRSTRGIWRAAADFLFPPACQSCREELSEETGDQSQRYCPSCASQIAASNGSACLRCGAPIGPFVDPHQPCGNCRNERLAFEQVIRLGDHDGQLRSAVLEAKAPGGEPQAAALAELTWSLKRMAFESARIDVVVPIPVYWLQRWGPAHHAADTLGLVWARRLQVPLATHILRKVRWTVPQTSLNRTQRRENLRGAFAVKGRDALAGARVLLADDVMTTGTTAHEAARQLKLAGAAQVIVAVVARGLGRR